MRRKVLGTLVGSTVLLGALALGAAPAAAVVTGVPAFVRSIGGEGRAPLSPWGVQWNPVSGELVATDYVNYEVRRFDASGAPLGDFEETDFDGDPDSVLASIAVDPADGDVYVAKPRPDRIARFSAAGAYLGDITVTGGTYIAWIATGPDGSIYALDSEIVTQTSIAPRLFKLAPDGTQLAVWPLSSLGTLRPELFGIDVAADGRIFLSDAKNRRIHVLGPDGQQITSFGTAGVGAGLLSADLRGVVLDPAEQRLYVADANDDQIEVFAVDGTYLTTFAGPGDGAGQLGGPRQVAFDGQGRLWVGEYGNRRLQAFDSTSGASLVVAPQPPQVPPPGLLGSPRDAAVDPDSGDVFVAEVFNQRFQRFSGTGALLGTWGSRENLPPYGLKYPRGIGYDPVLDRVWVTNHAAGTIMVYAAADMSFVMRIGDPTIRDASPGHFDKPMDVEFWGGRAIVGDPARNVVKVLDAATGAELFQIARRNNGSAVDPATGRIYAVDPQTDKVWVYGPDGGAPLFSFGANGTGDGQFRNGWDATIVDDVLWVTDEQLSRVQAFNLDGGFILKFGGYGEAPYQFRNPQGIGSDGQGRIYVTDGSNDRIQVFDTRTVRPAYESTRPTVGITAPANGAVVPAPIELTGPAADNAGVGGVELRLQDTSNGRWWDPQRSVWRSAEVWFLGRYEGPVTAATWRWTFPAPRPGTTYAVGVRSRDRSNNVSNVATRSFTVATGPPDAVAPDTTSSAAQVGRPTILTGAASDNVGVASVRVAIKNAATGQWWTGSGWGTFTYLPATVASPGAPSSSWSYSWNPPAGAGAYGFQAQARDTAGTFDPTPSTWRTFTVPA